MAIGDIGSIVAVAAAALASWLSFRGHQGDQTLQALEQLTKSLQEDNRVQRDLANDCQRKCQLLERRVHVLERMILTLGGVIPADGVSSD